MGEVSCKADFQSKETQPEDKNTIQLGNEQVFSTHCPLKIKHDLKTKVLRQSSPLSSMSVLNKTVSCFWPKLQLLKLTDSRHASFIFNQYLSTHPVNRKWREWTHKKWEEFLGSILSVVKMIFWNEIIHSRNMKQGEGRRIWVKYHKDNTLCLGKNFWHIWNIS